MPNKPFFDQVAAGLSLASAFADEKEVQVSCPSEMTVEFNRLVGVNRVTRDLGNKNLSLKFPNYPANNIERVSYDIEDGEFKLTIIPKPGMTSPKKEQVNFSYSGISADTVILVGGTNESHFPAFSGKELLGVKLVHIGTKELIIPKEKEVMSLAQPASSVSELVAKMLDELGKLKNPDINTNLLAGIEAGSNNFQSQQTTAQTFSLFAKLMKKGGMRMSKNKPENLVPGSVPGEVPSEAKKGDTSKQWKGPKIYKGTTVS